MGALYDQFVAAASAARPKLTPEKLVNDYGAHVYVSQTAQELGYIDVADSNYYDAVAGLAAAAQIDNQKYQVVRLTPQRNFLDGLAQTIGPQKILQSLGLSSPANDPDLSRKLLYLYQP
jgi:ClpP class serine protease